MWKVFCFLLLQSLCGLVTAQSTKASPWKTLSGSAPAIIARGGFSGIFPDSSYYAYVFASQVSAPNTILWCDVQLSKDGVGFCLPTVKMDNCTNIATLFPERKKVYLLDGVSTPGWFSVDFNSSELATVGLTQSIGSRTNRFDNNLALLSADEVVQSSTTTTPPPMWLNIQHDIFFTQHNLSMRKYVLTVSKRIIVSYLSSPEVGFLRGIAPRFRKTKTKLIFRFLGKDVVEPSTNQTYGLLLNNLTFIKTFAAGIIVPKQYIWPQTPELYLQSYTSIVMVAQKEGLEIYAADFANDAVISYNYSYNPLAEVLNFVDNGFFSVDGVIADFPITPSEAIGCFSHIKPNRSDHEKPIIISHNGASGDYPGCTDVAYMKAVTYGADIIDCSVQVTRDRILVCMPSIDLMNGTTAAKSPLRSQTSSIPVLKNGPGIFTFNVTWDDIQTKLKPLISSPEFFEYRLLRNPLHANDGRFMTLSKFLTFAKGKSLSGVLISIEHADFMAENLGFDVIDAVITTLNSTGYDKQTALGVTIQSTDSSVLVKFKQETKYSLMYMILNTIGEADASAIADIKTFADSVAIFKDSVFSESQLFTVRKTKLVDTLQKAGLAVYVFTFQNEFVSQDWDFYSDAVVEINSYVLGASTAGLDGIITDFPQTARAYKSNSCRKMGNNIPVYMEQVEPGSLVQLIIAGTQPPALPPAPILDVSDVAQSPVPPVKPAALSPPTGNAPAPPPAAQPSKELPRIIPSLLATLSAAFLGFLFRNLI